MSHNISEEVTHMLDFCFPETADTAVTEPTNIVLKSPHPVDLGSSRWRGLHRVLVGKPEGKKQLGRPRRRWKDNIKMDLHEVGGGCGDCLELAQDRDRWQALVSTVMNFWVPKMRGISWLATEPVSF